VASKSEGKRALERPSCRSEDNIKIDLNQGAKIWTRFRVLEKDKMAGSCKYDNGHERSIKVGVFFDWLINSWLLKSECLPCSSFFNIRLVFGFVI